MTLRPRNILVVTGVLFGVAVALEVVWIARHVLTWVVVSIFLALALNPAVSWLERRRGIGRGGAAAIIYLAFMAALTGLGFLLIPPLFHQASGLADAAPGYVEDLTKGEGPLGFLQERYHIVDRVRDAVNGEGGGAGLAGGTTTILSITKGILNVVVGVVTIIFMTFFMILEGPTWMERIYSLIPEESQPRWRAVGSRIAQTVSGYVTGNLFISLIAGGSSALVLYIADVPYALALGLLVAILDLIPLAGATLAGLVLGIVAFLTSVPAGIIVVTYFVIYQQVENHVLQPLVYGRTVQLSPLAVLIAVLIGAEVAGVLGALGAIPIAGTIQILLVEWRSRREGPGADPDDLNTPPAPDPAPGAAA